MTRVSAKVRVSNVALYIRSKTILGEGFSDQQILSMHGFADWDVYWETALSPMWNALKFVKFLEHFLLVRNPLDGQLHSSLSVIAAPFQDGIVRGAQWIEFNRVAAAGAAQEKLRNYNITDAHAAAEWIMGKPIYCDDCLPTTLKDFLRGPHNIREANSPSPTARPPQTIDGVSVNITGRPVIEYRGTESPSGRAAKSRPTRGAYAAHLKRYIDANLSKNPSWNATNWAQAAEHAANLASLAGKPWPLLPQRRALKEAVEKLLK
jgi:hypothetical protein